MRYGDTCGVLHSIFLFCMARIGKKMERGYIIRIDINSMGTTPLREVLLPVLKALHALITLFLSLIAFERWNEFSVRGKHNMDSLTL